MFPGAPNIDLSQATVLKTLLYCAYHHWKEGENLLHSPLGLKKVICPYRASLANGSLMAVVSFFEVSERVTLSTNAISCLAVGSCHT